MEWTAEVLAQKAGLITARAHYFWRLWHFALPETMEDDLRQEAWWAALQYAPDLPSLPLKIDDALRNLISYWLRGVHVTASERYLRYREPLEAAYDRPSREPDPAHCAEDRELIGLIWAQSNARMRTVWTLQALEGAAYLEAETYTMLGLNASSVKRARRDLQGLARQLART